MLISKFSWFLPLLPTQRRRGARYLPVSGAQPYLAEAYVLNKVKSGIWPYLLKSKGTTYEYGLQSPEHNNFFLICNLGVSSFLSRITIGHCFIGEG